MEIIEDIYNYLRKLGRFIVRLAVSIPLIYRNEDWDFSYLIDLIEFKIRHMRKSLIKHSPHSDVEKTSRTMGIVLCHIEHFKDIYKYVEYPEYDVWFEKLPNGLYTMKDNGTKAQHIKIAKTAELKNWHYEQIFRLILKYGRRWWW